MRGIGRASHTKKDGPSFPGVKDNFLGLQALAKDHSLNNLMLMIIIHSQITM